MRIALRNLAVAGALLLLCTSLAASAHDLADEAGVRHAMMSIFDQPTKRLTVGPIAVVGDAALAGWSQGESGGRALLRHAVGGWTILFCGGDALKSAAILEGTGLAPSQARMLAEHLGAAEATADPARIALFSRFDGLLAIDAGQSHHAPQATAAPASGNNHGRED